MNRNRLLAQEHIVHAIVVVIVLIASTIYAVGLGNATSDNIWIVYGSAIGYAAGRSGTGTSVGTRSGDST